MAGAHALRLAERRMAASRRHAMKHLWLSLALLSAVSCDRSPNSAAPPKIESVNDIPTPTNVGPPVQAMSYDDGYKAGDLAGEAAVKSQRARAPKHRPEQP